MTGDTQYRGDLQELRKKLLGNVRQVQERYEVVEEEKSEVGWSDLTLWIKDLFFSKPEVERQDCISEFYFDYVQFQLRFLVCWKEFWRTMIILYMYCSEMLNRHIHVDSNSAHTV